jgi:hypothetical protein
MSVYWLIWGAIWFVAAIFVGIIVGHLLKWRHGPMCECGHEADAHEHYRQGTECVECECQRFRRG